MSSPDPQQVSAESSTPVATVPPDGAAVPVVPGTPVVKQTERPHPLTPFIRGWLVLVAIILGFSRQFVESTNSEDGFGTSDLVWLLPDAREMTEADWQRYRGGVGGTSGRGSAHGGSRRHHGCTHR